MNRLSTLYGRRPVVVLALVQATLALGIGFGVPVTPAQFALLMTFSGTLFAFLAETQVVPMATLPDHVAAAAVIASNANVPKIPVVPIAEPPAPAEGRP